MQVFFRHISIKSKLRLVILLISGAVLLLASTAFIINDLIQFRRDMVGGLIILADLVGFNSTAGLLFKDAQAVQNSLTVLQVEPHILFTHVYNEQGEIFSCYTRQELSKGVTDADPSIIQQALAQPKPLYFFSKFYVDVFKPIFFQGEFVGTVHMRSDLTAFDEHLLKAGSIIITTLFISLLLAFALASWFQQMLTAPVYHLLNTINQIPILKNYAIRAHKTTDDELGRLIDGFNNMLAQIQKRDIELQEYRQHLEDMVIKRTDELQESWDQALTVNDILQRRTQELAEARDQAEAASTAKSTFLANMSHELRTPLNGILGYAQILNRNNQLDEQQRKGIQIIQSSGEYLLTLINDILDLSKIEAGRMELHPTEFNLPVFLHTIVEIFKLRAQSKGIVFTYQADNSLPAVVLGDEKRLRQIFMNLLGNALKFTEQGKVLLSVQHASEQGLVFKVKDTGIGITETDLEKIFSPFHQSGSYLQKAQGTGLGLSITKNLVTLMQGMIEVQSRLGEGSEFCVQLPLPVITTQAAQATTENTQTVRAYRCTTSPDYRYKILIVDDKIENRGVLLNLLKPLNFSLQEAENGQQAVDIAQDWQPDLILMDLLMPVLDGFDATRQILTSPNLPKLPIIAISASVFGEHRQQSSAAGCCDFVGKPFQVRELLEVLGKHLALDWIYAEESSENNALREAEKLEELPPQAALEQLQALAQRGHINGILSFLEELREQYPSTQILLNKIKVLAENFEDEQICNLVDTLLMTT